MGTLDPPGNSIATDSEALTRVLQIVERLSPEAQVRVLRTLNAFFSERGAASTPDEYVAPKRLDAQTSEPTRPSLFSEDRAPTIKEFLHEKRPSTDIEKVACLAYYLAHYRGTEDFKTVDISLLNTEAGQIKFSNAAYSVANAEKSGFLIASSRGQKRVSALGEMYVQALPDKIAAKEAISHARSRKRRSEARKK